jgi:hypothetical protein
VNTGLVAEVKWEVREVCRQLKVTSVDSPDEVLSATLNDHQIRLCLSGMIPAIARERVDHFLNEYHPDLVICSGLAGALRPSITVGDLIVHSEDSSLVGVAEQALTQIRLPFHVGPLVTVASPVLTPAAKQELAARSQAIAVDKVFPSACPRRPHPAGRGRGVHIKLAPDTSGKADADFLRHVAVSEFFRTVFQEYNATQWGSSSRIARFTLLIEPPRIDQNEMTDKGYINQSAVLTHRADLVDNLYTTFPPDEVVVIDA